MNARDAARVITLCVMCYVSCVMGVAAEEISPVHAELIAEHASIQPGGKTRVGVSFEIEPGWHIYAEDPGDAGLPTQIAWTAPAAVSFGPLVWPKAERFIDPGDIKTFGYRGTAVLYSRITFTPLLNPEGIYPDLPISAKIKWLACKEICLPGHAELSLSLPASTKPPLFSTHAQLFEQTDDVIPQIEQR